MSQLVITKPDDIEATGGGGPVTEEGSASDGLVFGDSAIGSSPSADWPNEPASYTLETDRPVAALDEDGWADCCDRISVVTDATDPVSPDKVLQHFYPDGEGGEGLSVPGGVSDFSLSGHQEVYVAFYMKVSDPWQEHSTNDSPKLVFISDSGTGGSGDPLVVHRRKDGQVAAYVQNSGDPPNRTFTPSGSVVVSPGEWALVEVQAIMNSTPSAADGVLRVWSKETLVIEETDVWFSDATTPQWTKISHNSIWGGQGDVLTQDNFLWKAHHRISGVV